MPQKLTRRTLTNIVLQLCLGSHAVLRGKGCQGNRVCCGIFREASTGNFVGVIRPQSEKERHMNKVLRKTPLMFVAALLMAGCATVEDVQRAQTTADEALLRADQAMGTAQSAMGTAQSAQQQAAAAQAAAQNAAFRADEASAQAAQARAAAEAPPAQLVVARGERG
jgi:hypothetical protein